VVTAGFSEQHDAELARLRGIELELNNELVKITKMLGNNPKIKFVHKKTKYEVEVPISLQRQVQQIGDFYVTSRREGLLRF